jgi:hypothetical protein
VHELRWRIWHYQIDRGNLDERALRRARLHGWTVRRARQGQPHSYVRRNRQPESQAFSAQWQRADHAECKRASVDRAPDDC